eukprot:CAMPEP_0167805198 /NCGR_PEP_ID=MMETSP0111_2-20121227/21030_1 /TAXON_ID=91324 /ORGANISM="Lotharella globosa, Strain CCCM811" /LENGTH=52 /DNA_ID=CAMNT_0007702295 /DNA_START=40 /DNA_END=195 /DNA_ORIENTATION=+
MCRGGVKREDEEKRKHGTEMNADPPSAPSERVSDSHETSPVQSTDGLAPLTL